MIAELVQKRLFRKRWIIIEETKIIYQTSKFGNETGISIPYEELTALKESHFVSNPSFGIVALILLGLNILSLLFIGDEDFNSGALIIWPLLLLLAICAYTATREIVWKIRLQNYTYIFINKKRPDEDEVDNFIEQLFSQRKKYLRDTYLQISKSRTYEPQYKNLQWLKKAEAIDSREYEQLLAELDVMFDIKKNRIGF